MKKTILSICLLLTVTAGGCNIARHNAYVLFGGSGQKVPAEFEGLSDGKVAVVIYADQKTGYQHRYLQSELSLAINQELKDKVRGIDLIAPKDVLLYQAQNLHWDSLDRTELARELGADYVLLVAVLDFRTHRPGSQHLFQGFLQAEASVWDASQDEVDARLWYSSDLSSIWPKDPSMGRVDGDDRHIRYRTQRLFAEQLVRKFHDHEEAL